MLVLLRKRNEKVILEDVASGLSVELVVVEIRGDKVRLGFTAPNNVAIWRSELGTFERRLRLSPQAAADVTSNGQEAP